MNYVNKYSVATVLSIVFALLYLYFHYERTCNIEPGNTIFALIVDTFAIVLSSSVLARLTQLESDQLGDLKDEKATVVLGFTFITVFTAFQIGTAFFDEFKLVPKVC